MQPSDHCLMPENRETFFKSSTSNDLAEWLASHQKMIKNSIDKWKKRSEKGSRNIGDWVKTFLQKTKKSLKTFTRDTETN